MATSDRAQEFLRSLAPFEKLEQSTRLLIQALKHEFPYQNALKSHLTELGVPRLADYLVWIPHHRFEEDMEEIGRGGFGTVHKATVEAFDERGFKTLHKNGDELVYDKNFVRTFALKEVDISIIVPESWPGTIVRLVGLSQHQETKNERPSDVGDTWEWLQKSIKYSSAAPRTESYPLSAETTTFLSNLRVAYAKEQAKNRALGKVISSKSAPLHQQPLTRSQFHTRASLRAISQQWSRGALQAAATATSQTNASTAKAIENEPEPSVSTKKKKQQSVRFKVEELQTYRPRRNRRYSLPLV
ncbi:hypothetical protein BC936DRAFT_148684 [Jimgerdemannia flammicorona]|uniref:Uncharacterized protein n=1 Tax=Jimgerdemannia flammicorona TaxID=994334 RepID=A0A433D2I6_9FUNG|nr:hypothetical protein BC936DRAFT_148684 [Jimgerdemannia flammicorona]